MFPTQSAWPSPAAGAMISTAVAPALVPRMDVVETQNQLLYILEMPGVMPGKMAVELDGNSILVSGTVDPVVGADEQAVYHYQERITTAFQRAIPLPENLQADQAEASLTHGLLQISFAKGQAAPRQKKKIKVTEG